MMDPPDELSEKAKDIWQDIESNASRKLNRSDYVIIESFCCNVDLYDQAVKEIREGDFTNTHNQVSPAVTVANKSANNIRQLYKAIEKFQKEERPSNSNMRSVKNF